MSYSDLEYEIFSRQFILQNFNEENIQKLNKAKITIVGLGGIGCPLAQYLVSSGIKNFTFFDGDLIEKSNLARQILYSFEDIGKFKTLVAKEKLLKIVYTPVGIDKFLGRLDRYMHSLKRQISKKGRIIMKIRIDKINGFIHQET